MYLCLFSQTLLDQHVYSVFPTDDVDETTVFLQVRLLPMLAPVTIQHLPCIEAIRRCLDFCLLAKHGIHVCISVVRDAREAPILQLSGRNPSLRFASPHVQLLCNGTNCGPLSLSDCRRASESDFYLFVVTHCFVPRYKSSE